MEPAVESMRWVVASLVILAAWMIGVVYLLSSGPSKFLGGCLLATGTLNALFYKGIGRKFFAKTQSSRPFVARFWARSGEKGIQLFYLGIGVIFAVAGCFLILVGSA